MRDFHMFIVLNYNELLTQICLIFHVREKSSFYSVSVILAYIQITHITRTQFSNTCISLYRVEKSHTTTQRKNFLPIFENRGQTKQIKTFEEQPYTHKF